MLEEARAIYGDVALTLLLTEDQVKAPQTIYNELLGRVTTSQTYSHDHVLRAYITSPIGDAVDCTTDHFEANYEYTLNGAWNTDNIEGIGLLTKKVDAVTDDNVLDMDIINANSFKLGVLTGIETVAAPASTKSSAYYSLDGRLLDATHLKPGIYVTNGKKVIVK